MKSYLHRIASIPEFNFDPTSIIRTVSSIRIALIPPLRGDITSLHIGPSGRLAVNIEMPKS